MLFMFPVPCTVFYVLRVYFATYLLTNKINYNNTWLLPFQSSAIRILSILSNFWKWPPWRLTVSMNSSCLASAAGHFTSVLLNDPLQTRTTWSATTSCGKRSASGCWPASTRWRSTSWDPRGAARRPSSHTLCEWRKSEKELWWWKRSFPHENWHPKKWLPHSAGSQLKLKTLREKGRRGFKGFSKFPIQCWMSCGDKRELWTAVVQQTSGLLTFFFGCPRTCIFPTLEHRRLKNSYFSTVC